MRVRIHLVLLAVVALLPVVAFSAPMVFLDLSRAPVVLWTARAVGVGFLFVGTFVALLLSRQYRRLVAAAGEVADGDRAADAARALAEVAREIAGPLDLPRVAERIVSVVRRTLRAEGAALFELSSNGDDLVCVATAGSFARQPWVGRTIGRGVGVVGRALAEDRPVRLADVSAVNPALRYPEWAVQLLGDARYSSMAAPLTVRGETVGVLGLAGKTGREFSADDLDLLSALAHQAAVALQNARFYRDQELRARRLGVLNRLNQLISASLDADGVLGALTKAAAEITDAPYAAIWLVDRTSTFLERHSVSVEAYPLQRQRLGVGLMGWAAQHRIIVNVSDATIDPRTSRPDWFKTAGFRSAVAIPIIHESTLLGVLTLTGTRPFVLEGGLREMLDSFVAQSAIAIRNAQLFEEAQRRRRQAEMLAVLARTIGATLDLDAVLQQAVEATRDLLGSDRAQIALRVPDADVMVMRYGAPRRLGREFEGLSIEKSKGLGGLAWALGRPVRTDDYPEDPRFTHEYDTVVRAVGLVAVLAVPIVIADEVEGLLYVNNRAPRPFTEHDEAVLVDVALHAAIAIQNARLFERVQSAGDRLAGLSRRLLDVQETERRYLARELHDEIGQLLTGLTLILERSKRLPAEASLTCISEAQALTTELLSRVRNLSLDLWPAVLDDLGLLPALLWHFERYTASTGVRVAFKQRGLDGRRFAPEIETAGYRIVQEALTNVARHSGAPEAMVTIVAADGWLRLAVEDDGAGFDPDAALKNARSSGLTGLRERTRLSNGRATVTSACGAGTRLTAELPTDGPPERERR